MSDGTWPFTPLPAAALLDAHVMSKRTTLDPILTEAGLALLYGPRGIGKSFLALGIAWALASGREFLRWRSIKPHRVLYLDGELASTDLQSRLASLGPPPAGLHFLTAGMQGSALPNLCRGAGDRVWEPWMEDGFPHLLVVDSLSSIVGETRYAAERWAAVRRWLLRMREMGIGVLIVHHATRKGAPRGPSHREDVFDLVMALRHPPGYEPREGLRFELHFEKARGLHGAAVDPFEARMTIDRMDRAHWDWRPTGSAELHRVAALLESGLNPNQIARKLGISKSKSYRLREQAQAIFPSRPSLPQGHAT